MPAWMTNERFPYGQMAIVLGVACLASTGYDLWTRRDVQGLVIVVGLLDVGVSWLVYAIAAAKGRRSLAWALYALAAPPIALFHVVLMQRAGVRT